MKYLYFSDLHLACDDSIDNFSKKKLFLNFIKWKDSQNFKRTYVLGDIFELWQGGKTFKADIRLNLIEKRYGEIIKILNNYELIVGNHDWEAKERYEMKEEAIIKSNNLRILCMHGHQFDEQYRDKISVKIARIATEGWGFLEALIGKKQMERILPSVEKMIEISRMKQKESAQHLDDEEYIKKAIKYAKDKNCNIVVIGHTHKPKFYYDKNEKIYYINTGTWAEENKANFVILETDKKNIKIGNFINNKPQFLDIVHIKF